MVKENWWVQKTSGSDNEIDDSSILLNEGIPGVIQLPCVLQGFLRLRILGGTQGGPIMKSTTVLHF